MKVFHSLQKNGWLSLGIASLFVASINAFTLGSWAIGLITLLGYIYGASALFGSRYIQQNRLAQITIGSVILLSGLAIGGSLLYYIGPITRAHLFILALLLLAVSSIVSRPNAIEQHQTVSQKGLFAFILLLISITAWWTAVGPISISEAVRSLWLVIPTQSLIAIALSALILIIATPLLSPSWRIVSYATVLGSITLLPAATYILGYGFDPFIHRATVAHIAEFGTITPKPLYYIGQYALELFATHLFSLPLFWVDNLLVPLLSITIIPALILTTWPKSPWASLALFFVPLGAFITTTPQSLAYLFLTASLFLSIRYVKMGTSPFPFLLASTATLITHPLAGIPLIIYAALVLLYTYQVKTSFRLLLAAPLLTLGSVIMPLVFFLQAKLAGLPLSFSLADIQISNLHLPAFFANHFSTVFDGAYLLIDNTLWITVGLAFISVGVVLYRKPDSSILLPTSFVLLLFINYAVLSLTLDFDFLIEYERQNYAQRLLTMMQLFSLPAIAVLIQVIAKRLKTRPPLLRAGFTLTLCLFFTANAYGAFPRHDNYARSAGFNVSQTDIETAAAIEQEADGQPYIALANQAVSAAALDLFGFATYYNDEIFYYPIPTGGELYQFYLKMADEHPTRSTMQEAMDLTDVDLGFFVINDYWWEAERIIEEAKEHADTWFGIGESGQQAMVFIFRRE